jgi:hypothetical protein
MVVVLKVKGNHCTRGLKRSRRSSQLISERHVLAPVICPHGARNSVGEKTRERLSWEVKPVVVRAGFAGGDQALVEGARRRIVPNGDQGRHVEHVPDLVPTAGRAMARGHG